MDRNDAGWFNVAFHRHVGRQIAEAAAGRIVQIGVGKKGLCAVDTNNSEVYSLAGFPVAAALLVRDWANAITKVDREDAELRRRFASVGNESAPGE